MVVRNIQVITLGAAQLSWKTHAKRTSQWLGLLWIVKGYYEKEQKSTEIEGRHCFRQDNQEYVAVFTGDGRDGLGLG
jgi:hypothetical protein